MDTQTGITITVHCFSHVRHVLGTATVELRLPTGSDTSAVEREIREMGGASLAGLPMRIALNKAFVNEPQPLADGDEVALIPPVQGG